MRIQLTFFITHIYVILRENCLKYISQMSFQESFHFFYIKILILKKLVPLPLKRKFQIS